MLYPIFFQGYWDPCEAEFGIHLDRDTDPTTLHIVVIQAKGGTSLWNDGKARDAFLNQVLNNHAVEVQIDRIRLHLILDQDVTGMRGIELPVRADIRSMRPGSGVKVTGLFRKTYSAHSHAIVTGAVRCYTDFEERRLLSKDELDRFCAVLGYYSPYRLKARQPLKLV
jgi:hypothetical protein